MTQKFTVRFQEIICYRADVEAENERHAIAKARKLYEDGEYVKETDSSLDHFEAVPAKAGAR